MLQSLLNSLLVLSKACVLASYWMVDIVEQYIN